MLQRQKSFRNEEDPALFLVPTPIGNLNEVSPRIREVLEQVDVIACEDTRNSGMLLKRLDISKPLISHHEHNTAASIPGILKLLEQGKKVAMISDAGYPVISDPGAGLALAVMEEGYRVIPISGPNAALDALVASGLDARHFLYYGFLDAKSTKRKKELESLRDVPWTMIFYEAPHRIEDTLKDMREVLGNRQICLARELTKLHEEFLRGTIDEVLDVTEELKGEMVLVVQGQTELPEQSLEQVTDLAMELAQSGLKPKAAAAKASENSGFSKNEIYAEMMRRKEADNG